MLVESNGDPLALGEKYGSAEGWPFDGSAEGSILLLAKQSFLASQTNSTRDKGVRERGLSQGVISTSFCAEIDAGSITDRVRLRNEGDCLRAGP